MNGRLLFCAMAMLATAAFLTAPPAIAQDKPNIVVIMGDDVGWFEHRRLSPGHHVGKTPNLDQLAIEGMMFTDYYAEASCTAGRASFHHR